MKKVAALCAFAALSTALAAPVVTLKQSSQGLTQPIQLTVTVDNQSQNRVKVGRIRNGEVACPFFKLFSDAGGPPRIERYITANCDVGEVVNLLPKHRQTFGVTLPWNDLDLGWYTAILELPVNNKTQYLSARVYLGNKPETTPTPKAYHAALSASGATWHGRTSIYAPANSRLQFDLADELSRQAFLAELKKRGLDASKIDIRVASPVKFPTPPTFAHTAKIDVQHARTGYVFTLTVTNTSGKAVEGNQATACEPAAIERVSDGLRVWQRGNGPCIQLGYPPKPLAPGKSVTRTLKWDGRDSTNHPVTPGTYRIRLAHGQFVGETTFTVK